jgi:hypothetical protein
MDTALPGLADDGHADLVRDTLVTLLTVMRPDWGSRQAVAGRVSFAEHRLGLSLPQVCLHAVTAAVTPNAPPDAFRPSAPADAPAEALRHLADPEHTSATIAQLRRQLLEAGTTRPTLTPTPAPTPASPPGSAPSPVAGEHDQRGDQRDDPEQVAADRAMLAQAMAVAHRRQGRQEWTRRQRTGEHADDSATPDDEW